MKIKSVAAVGALGLGLGVASLAGAGTASAQTCAEDTPPLTPNRVVCVIGEQTGTFFMSVSPATQIDTFLNGAPDDTDFGSLGILNQPQTFVNSVVGPGGFLDGPRSPE
jgi:hypothetical protein